MDEVRNLIIIGFGPSGYTAALYAARAKPFAVPTRKPEASGAEHVGSKQSTASRADGEAGAAEYLGCHDDGQVRRCIATGTRQRRCCGAKS
jgi:thioredoxin reductase